MSLKDASGKSVIPGAAAIALAIMFALLPSVGSPNKKPPWLDPVMKPGSGKVPASCGTDPVTSPKLLDCWLLKQSWTIRHFIQWPIADANGNVQTVKWDNWDEGRRAQLRQAFLAAWLWHQGGMTTYTGTPVPDPPPNQELLADDDWVVTVFDEQTEAWPLYLAFVAQTFAAEIGGWVPWSIKSYDPQLLFDLLASNLMFARDSDIEGDLYNSDYPGGFFVWGEATYAHPTYLLKFLNDNGLIGATPFETVGKVVGWTRNLSHYVKEYSPPNLEHHWQYRGDPPMSRVIEGTNLTDPVYGPFFPGERHWTGGCHGTTEFVRALLRVVNIPVQRRADINTCYHWSPYFPTLQLSLSHGDDPYTWFSFKATYPADQLLIDETTWQAWFASGDLETSCGNVGRRPAELAVWNFSEPMYQTYCSDLANGLGHGSSLIYQYFSSYFTLGELEATDLWGRLDLAVQSAGGCAAFPP